MEISKWASILFRVSLMLSLLSISCATISTNNFLDYRSQPKYSDIDPTFNEMIAEFKKDVGMENVNHSNRLTMGFDDLYGNTVGMCWRFRTGKLEISISKKAWNSYTANSKWQLVYHELAHCLCSRPHNHRYGEYRMGQKPYTEGEESRKKEGFFKDGCPTSFMYPVVLSEDCIREHWGEYIAELREGCQK